MSILSKAFGPVGVAVMTMGAGEATAQSIDFNINLCGGGRDVSVCATVGTGLGGVFNNRGNNRHKGRSYAISPNGSCRSGYTKTRTGNASGYYRETRSGRFVPVGQTYCVPNR